MHKLFKIDFLVNSKGNFKAIVNIDTEILEVFDEMLDSDLKKVFEGNKFNEKISEIVEMLIEEVSKS